MGAYHINDVDWIAGVAFANVGGSERVGAVRLVPEPATLALLALGCLGALLRRKRR
jgi:hypothetical protein